MAERKAFDSLKCNMCEYQGNCSLRDIAPDLYGCMGHGKLHHRFTEEKERLMFEAIEKCNAAQVLTEERIKELKAGDKVKLMGTTIALGLNLPRYLDNGTFTVLGIARNGKIKCDWDGGKPFNIPALCLEKVEDQDIWLAFRMDAYIANPYTKKRDTRRNLSSVI